MVNKKNRMMIVVQKISLLLFCIFIFSCHTTPGGNKDVLSADDTKSVNHGLKQDHGGHGTRHPEIIIEKVDSSGKVKAVEEIKIK